MMKSNKLFSFIFKWVELKGLMISLIIIKNTKINKEFLFSISPSLKWSPNKIISSENGNSVRGANVKNSLKKENRVLKRLLFFKLLFSNTFLKKLICKKPIPTIFFLFNIDSNSSCTHNIRLKQLNRRSMKWSARIISVVKLIQRSAFLKVLSIWE